MEIEAGTTGYCGGDSGHGGRTYFSIKDLGGTDLHAEADKDKFGSTHEVKILVGGDAELTTMIEALEFILQVLKDGADETVLYKG